ncbi:hypothetical protein ACLKA6_006973 [Drosophila palustris]
MSWCSVACVALARSCSCCCMWHGACGNGSCHSRWLTTPLDKNEAHLTKRRTNVQPTKKKRIARIHPAAMLCLRLSDYPMLMGSEHGATSLPHPGNPGNPAMCEALNSTALSRAKGQRDAGGGMRVMGNGHCHSIIKALVCPGAAGTALCPSTNYVSGMPKLTKSSSHCSTDSA